MPKFSSCELTAIILVLIASGLMSCIAFYPKEDRTLLAAFAGTIAGGGLSYLRTAGKNNENS